MRFPLLYCQLLTRLNTFGARSGHGETKAFSSCRPTVALDVLELMDKLKHFYNFYLRGGSPALSVERKPSPPSFQLPGCSYRRLPILILWLQLQEADLGAGERGFSGYFRGIRIGPSQKSCQKLLEQTLGPVLLLPACACVPILPLHSVAGAEGVMHSWFPTGLSNNLCLLGIPPPTPTPCQCTEEKPDSGFLGF